MTILTPFGKTLRKLRIDRGETQMDVAEAIGISVAFLSAVETGKKNASKEVIDKLIRHNGLDQSHADSLRRDALVSREEVIINMRNLDDPTRELVAGFARRFEEDSLDAEQRRRLLEIFGIGK